MNIPILRTQHKMTFKHIRTSKQRQSQMIVLRQLPSTLLIQEIIGTNSTKKMRFLPLDQLIQRRCIGRISLVIDMPYLVLQILITLIGPHLVSVLIQQLKKHQEIVTTLILSKSHSSNRKSTNQPVSSRINMIQVRVINIGMQLVHLLILKFIRSVQLMSVDLTRVYLHLRYRLFRCYLVVTYRHELSVVRYLDVYDALALLTLLLHYRLQRWLTVFLVAFALH